MIELLQFAGGMVVMVLFLTWAVKTAGTHPPLNDEHEVDYHD